MKHLPLLCAAGSVCLSAPAAEQTPRPNVLFIIMDDLTTAIGCYGDRDARTPNMDALAARGVRFEHAYCQFSLCAPSRSSFLTGCYPDRTKVYNLSTSFRVALPDVVTLPELFKKEGYTTGLIGKVFHGGGPKIKPDLVLSAPLHRDNGILAEAKAKNDPSDKPKGKAEGGEKSESYNRCYAASDRPDKDFTDYEIADRAIAALEQFKDKPFFLTVGFIRPHTPYVAPQAFFDQFDPQEISMPPFYRPGGEDLSSIPKAALRPNNNVFRYQAPTPEEARDARRAYLAASSFSDAQLGRVLAKLKELDLDKNTVIALVGDNGYQLGEHGLWAKQTLFRGGTSVPLIVSVPGGTTGVCSGLVEQVDIYPTLAGLAGLPLPETVQGKTMQPLLEDPSRPGKSYVFSVMQSTVTKEMGRSISDGRFTYIEWDEGRAGRQLYDNEKDPDQLHNLADQPEQAEFIKDMHKRLKAHLNEVQ
ncbi:MAG: sulfatase [Kiritimatiellales bacterium]|jgi:uncharacterized sulfatase